MLCLGAGGSAVAMALHLINKPDAADRPRAFHRRQPFAGPAGALRQMVGRLDTDIAFEYICNQDPRLNDETMARCRRAARDQRHRHGQGPPGSPITDAGLFPLDGIAWEFNYRGELDFLHQAVAQRAARQLRVEDGWLYFLHGWTQVIAQVFHMPIEGELFQRLAAIAADDPLTMRSPEGITR